MKKFKISCPCHFGLESVLKFEAIKLGFQDISAENGRVTFSGGFEEVASANINLRTAERVQILLSTFTAKTFEELFDNVYNIPFEDFIGEKNEFPVTGYSLNSTLTSVPACQSIIKKAVVKRLESKYHISLFDETAATIRIQFAILKNKVSIYLDTSGAGLHKRGYRQISNTAPIKETLAAGIIDLARVKSNSTVYDPFCGSGTILIESALRAFSIAPGINRRFNFELWDCFDSNIVDIEREKAKDLVNRTADFVAYGSDIDQDSIDLTLDNAKKAGVSSKIKVSKMDFKTMNFNNINDSIVITNPPYGERMLDIIEAEKLYQVMGDKFTNSNNNKYYIISPHENFEQIFGKKSDKKRKLYNGMIKCELFMYLKDK